MSLINPGQIQTVLLHANQLLSSVSDTARLDAELLLAKVLGITRTQLLARSNQFLNPQQLLLFQQLIARRQQGEPIAYILGYKEFWSLSFIVTPATLIPRPETELLVELLLQKFPVQAPLKIADLGTGCGAIALALAHERPQWLLTATDNSKDALAVAEQNAKQLGITRINFRYGNWCEALAAECFDVIISNPPYIAADDPHLQQGDLRFEPCTALVATERGLADLEKIIVSARAHLYPEGYLFLEHGYDQADAVKKILLQHHYKKIVNYTDFIGVKRVACAQL